MEKKEQPVQQYTALLSRYEEDCRQCEKQLRWLGMARLSSLTGVVWGGWKYAVSNEIFYFIPALLLLVLFVFLVVRSNNTRRRKRLSDALCRINREEIEFLIERKHPWYNGMDYLNPQHPFAADLDIFGEQSLFQHLNRTVSQGGEKRLAQMLSQQEQWNIPDYQEAVKELARSLEWRQLFVAAGLQKTSDKQVDAALKTWEETPLLPPVKITLLKLLAWGLPLFTILSLSGWLAGLTGSNTVFLLFIINLGITISLVSVFRRLQRPLESLHKNLGAYSGMLKCIAEGKFSGPFLVSLQHKLGKTGTDAPAALNKLESILDQFDSLANPLAVVLVDGLLLYHVHGLLRLQSWKEKHEKHIKIWLAAVYEMDMLCSLANYACNNPLNCYPEICAEPCFNLQDAAHPLLPHTKRVANSIGFKSNKLFILTGSNMAGKSTFLRTLGISLVMARAGLPVCAGAMKCYPFDLLTSMRVADSLAEGESLFFAELKRLHNIIEHLREGHHCLVLLDEILRGTNSADKYKGTSGYLKQLIGMQCTGILATNDLKVTGLEEQFPSQLKNICFEVKVTDQGLSFDYLLKDGICSKLSASYLMQQMGIIEHE